MGKPLYHGYMVSSKLCILDHKAKKKIDLGAYRSQPPLYLLLNWDFHYRHLYRVATHLFEGERNEGSLEDND